MWPSVGVNAIAATKPTSHAAVPISERITPRAPGEQDRQPDDADRGDVEDGHRRALRGARSLGRDDDAAVALGLQLVARLAGRVARR
jgi:hypothetical protein